MLEQVEIYGFTGSSVWKAQLMSSVVHIDGTPHYVGHCTDIPVEPLSTLHEPEFFGEVLDDSLLNLPHVIRMHLDQHVLNRSEVVGAYAFDVPRIIIRPHLSTTDFEHFCASVGTVLNKVDVGCFHTQPGLSQWEKKIDDMMLPHLFTLQYE